jgi:ADP-heptose:LPS heptosyltransferase
MRDLRADLALQLHGSGETSNAIAASLGATRLAGFVRAGGAPPTGSIALPWSDSEPEPTRWLRLLDAAGIPGAGHELEFPLAGGAATRARRQLGLPTGAAWAVVHPGAARLHGRWSLEGFRAVAGRLGALGLRVVVTGTSDEADLTSQVAAAAPGAVDLAGRTDLDGLGGLIAGARLLVANDTGAAHLACALGTPSVVVFATGDQAYFERWAALDRVRHVSLPPYPAIDAVLHAVDRQLSVAAAVA